MSFQDEMKQMFLRVAAGKVEPEEWGKWWNSNKIKLEEILTRGDRGRIMPAFWSASYYWMAKTQSGVAYYFHAQGRPVKVSGYYEKKAQEAEMRDRQKAMEKYDRDTAPARQRWEGYLGKHPTEQIAFDWKSLLGTPPGQKPAKVFDYKNARTQEQWKACSEELKLRLKENLQKGWGVIQYGTEAEGYTRLEKCVEFHSDYMADRLKERPGAYNDPREPIAVMYHNAQLFIRTKQIADAEKRRNAIRETYEEVCRFMRYYHGLEKKTERD